MRTHCAEGLDVAFGGLNHHNRGLLDDHAAFHRNFADRYQLLTLIGGNFLIADLLGDLSLFGGFVRDGRSCTLATATGDQYAAYGDHAASSKHLSARERHYTCHVCVGHERQVTSGALTTRFGWRGSGRGIWH